MVYISTPILESIPSYSSISTTPDQSLAVVKMASQKQVNHNQAAQQPSTGITIAIALSVIFSVLLLVAVLIWHLRLRSRAKNRKRLSESIKPVDFPGPAQTSAPLVSPAGAYRTCSAPQTPPPPRLQERQFLLPRVMSRRNRQRAKDPDWPGVPLFPMPLRTTSTAGGAGASSDQRQSLEPETSRTSISPLMLPRGAHNLNSSFSSFLSTSTTIKPAASTNSSNDISTRGERFSVSTTDVELPQKPQHVYMALPVVGGLHSPGPPPNRALPSTPSSPSGRGASPPRSPLSTAENTAPPRRDNHAVEPGALTPTAIREALEAGILSERISRSRNSSASSIRSNGTGGTGLGAQRASPPPRRVGHLKSPLLNKVDCPWQ